MKATTLAVMATACLVAACSVSKKNRKAVPDSTPVTKTNNVTQSPTPGAPLNTFVFPKTAKGIYAPGTGEVTAMQAQDKTVTLDKLKEGYTLYSQGACINCHEAKDIYQFKETDWKGIIDDMAIKAQISAAQKDAVYKYVLSIKATQPK